MKRKNNSEVFLQKIFERSQDPIAQLERINSIVPMFFANEQNVALVNKELDSFGYQINDQYVSEMKNQLQMFGHPCCGIDSGYGSGHPSCGIGSGYGSGHPSCGIGGGYGSGHPSCGIGSGYGSGHPSCCSSKNERGKSLLLVRNNNSDRYNEVRN